MAENSFDITILPLHRQAGQDQPSLPGVQVAVPPKRPARGRKTDRLIFFLSFEGQHSFSTSRIKQLLESLEKAYYAIPGTVTSAMRALVEDLNNIVLNYNQRRSDSGEHIVALFGMAVIRGDHLYLAQSGPVHGFLLTPGKVEHVYDAELSGRGLGVSRNPTVRFFQTELTNKMVLLLTHKLPTGWKGDTFKGAHGQPLKALWQRFMNDAGENISAILIEARQGRGTLQLLRTSQIPEEPAPVPVEEKLSPRPRPVRPSPEQPKSDTGAWTPVETPHTEKPEKEQTAPPPIISTPVDPGLGQPSVSEPQPEQQTRREDMPPRRQRTSPETPAVLDSLKSVGRVLGRGFLRVRAFFKRIMPGDEFLKIPTSAMAITAIAVPLVVVAIAALVYTQIGKVQQFDYYLAMAQAESQAALTETDNAKRHAAWENTLTYLDLAEEYETSEEAEALRLQAIQALDQMDSILRLEFKPAIAGTLAKSVKIRRIVAANRDVFMLDITSGSVIRAWLTGTHYEIDPDFKCGPGQADPNSPIVGPLVDIALLERASDDTAAIVGLDANGNLLLCVPDSNPEAYSLIPPNSGWGNPTAITVENDKLYILDPLTNAVWFYESIENRYSEAPYFFFIDEVPTLEGAIDLAVDRDTAYILFKDGSTTTCTYSTLKEAPTTCEEPAIYTDSRTGRESGSQIPGVFFFRIQHTQPPEPSLFYLDPANQAIYHFSLRLNLVQVYQPQADFPAGPLTAFAISPTRSVFIAQENEVYIAYLP